MPSSQAVLSVGFLIPLVFSVSAQVPAQAQLIDWKSFNVLDSVPPPTEANDSTVCHPHFPAG